MKKALVLVLTLAMVLSVAIVASAATTTVGGNVRVWYINADNNDNLDNTFKFDRFALDVKSDLGDGASLFTEIQGRNTNKTKNTETQFFVDKAYFAQTNLLLEGSTFMVGAFDGDIPFKNGYSNVILSGGIGDGIKIGQAVGVIYKYKTDLFNIGVGVCNANQGFAKNVDNTDMAGYSWSTRFELTPVAGLNVGVGYASWNDVVKKQNLDIDADNDKITWPSDDSSIPNQIRYVVDASYQNLDVTPVSGKVEWGKVDYKSDSTEDVDAYYAELGYTFADRKAVAYVGHGDGDIYGSVIKSSMGAFAINDDNYTVAGLKYALTGNIALQGEYATVDSDNYGYGIRLMVSF
jgi:hypothetical protein